jgi:hypothetical protein
MQSNSRIRPFVDITSQITMLRKQDSDHIYVLNETKNMGSQAGVIISLTDEHGRGVSVSCPNTFIPIDIAEDLDKNTIMKGTNFLNMLRQGKLRVISDTEAEATLNSSDALYESKRLYLERHSGGEEVTDDVVNTGANALSIGNNQSQPNMAAPPTNEPGLPPLRSGIGVVAEGESTEGVNPRVVEAFDVSGHNDEDRYHIIKRQDNLTDVDLHYIMSHTQDERLRSWASDQRYAMHRSQ